MAPGPVVHLHDKGDIELQELVVQEVDDADDADGEHTQENDHVPPLRDLDIVFVSMDNWYLFKTNAPCSYRDMSLA